MSLVGILVMSIVTVFSFTSLPLLQNRWVSPHVPDARWSASFHAGEPYRPSRMAVLTDWDGYAHRSADGGQLTRRDRGREFWQPTSTNKPGSQPSFRGWLAEKLDLPTPAPIFSSSRSASSPVVNFSPGNTKQTVFRVSPKIGDYSVSSSEAEFATAPVSLETAHAPLPPPTMPLRQYQVEVAPASAPPAPTVPAPSKIPDDASMSIGRRVQNLILNDDELPQACKLTIRVSSSAGGKIVLRGIVPNQSEKDRIGSKAASIAGAGRIDNRLVALIGKGSGR